MREAGKLEGYIHSFESFGTVDGPGIRFVVFMQGCPLRCKYCHNPDTWTKGGTAYTAEQVCAEALKYRNYFGDTGGVTVSGGEPLLQMDFVTELFERLKAFIDTLETVKKVEVLPYHTMGEVKYEKLGYDYPLKGVRPPEKERVQNAKRLLGIIK